MKRNKVLFALMMCFALIAQPSLQGYAAGAATGASATKKTGAKKGKKKKVKKVTSSSTSESMTSSVSATGPKTGADYSVMNFLPFGVGQFTQGKTLVGGVFAGSQAAMLFLFLDRKKQIDLSNSDADATYKEVLESGEDADQATLDYLAQNEAYVKKTQQEANLALLGFVGLYALGVVDAIWDPLGLRPSKTSMVGTMTEQEKKIADAEKVKPSVGLFVLPTGASSSYGFTFNKALR